MATVKIEVKDGVFVSENPKEFDKNGFRGTIQEDGSVIVTRYKGDGGVDLRIYPDGNYKVTNSDGKSHRGRLPLTEGRVNCTIGMHSDIHNKWAFVRDSTFQDWLVARGITRVERRDPNGLFTGIIAKCSFGDAYFHVWSDGNGLPCLWRIDNLGETWAQTEHYYYEVWCNVSGASWAIVTRRDFRKDRHVCDIVLYTQVKDVTSLDIPLIEQ